MVLSYGRNVDGTWTMDSMDSMDSNGFLDFSSGAKNNVAGCRWKLIQLFKVA
jgi:hypothetical protein